jgi:hypothetical protein
MPVGEYGKHLPKFAGNSAVSVQDHFTAFLKFVDNLEVEYEDLVMKMFMQTLEGDARTCYKSLPAACIDGWGSFKCKFTEKWGYKKDNSFLLEFISIRKDKNEIVSEFNNRFSKVYMRIPQHVRPNDIFSLVYYFKVFDESFGFFLREDI